MSEINIEKMTGLIFFTRGNSFNRGVISPYKVTRETEKSFWFGSNGPYRKKNISSKGDILMTVGGSWSSTTYYIATKELIEEYKLQKTRKVAEFSFEFIKANGTKESLESVIELAKSEGYTKETTND